DLEYRYDVPLLRLTELGYQQNRRRQQPLGRIIKIGVLPEGSGVHAGEDDGLRDDLGVFFASGLIYQLVRVRLVQVHIFIDQMQEVIAVAPGRVPICPCPPLEPGRPPWSGSTYPAPPLRKTP